MSWFEEITNPPIYKTVHDIKSPKAFKENTTPTFQITKSKSKSSSNNRQHIHDLKIKKGWEMAMAPIKSLPMTLFMNYMTGNSLQIISISMTLMLFVNPIKAIFNINEQFAFLNSDADDSNSNGEQGGGLGTDVVIIKLAFVAAQILGIAVGIWKLNNMGLIPNSTSDWLAWESYPKFDEISLGIF